MIGNEGNSRRDSLKTTATGNIGLPVAFVFIAFIYACLLTVSVIAPPSQFISFMSSALFLLLLIMLWKVEKYAFIIMIPLIVGHTWPILSNIYLEGGSFVLEQGVFSYPTGSTIRLVGLVSVMLLFAFITFRLFTPRPMRLQIPVMNLSFIYHKRILLLACFSLSLIVALGLMNYGSPIISAIDRIDYWNAHPMPQIRMVSNQFPIMAFFLGCIYVVSENKWNSTVVVMALMLFVIEMILLGEKFTGLFSIGYHYLMGYLLVTLLIGRSINTKTLARYLLFVLVALLLLSFYHYRTIYGVSNVGAIDKLMERAFALQGHVWWGIDRLVAEGVEPIGLENLFSPHSYDSPGGLYKLMYNITSSNVYYAYLDKGVRFTMGYPAIVLYSLGYMGSVLFQIIAGMYIGVLAAYMFHVVRYGHIIRTIIALKLLLLTYSFIFSMGDLFLIYSTKYIILSILVFIDLLILKSKKVSYSLVPDNILPSLAR